VAHADVVTTTTHKTLRGPRSGLILCRSQHAAIIDRCVFPGQQGGPLVHIVAAKATCFLEALKPSFVDYQRRVITNAQAMAAAIAEGGYRVVSGGTDTHLALIDVFAKGVKGKDAEKALDEAYITVNKNGIPFDQNPPLNPSGIRVGSPALTTRGFTAAEMRTVGALITEVLDAVAAHGLEGAEPAIHAVRAKVGQLTDLHPLYEWKLARA
jgi:glycine hydroxymethyltransferase